MQMPGDYILSVIYIQQKQIADTSNKSFDNREEAQHLHHSKHQHGLFKTTAQGLLG